MKTVAQQARKRILHALCAGALLAGGATCPAAGYDVSGDYGCVSIGSQPCGASTDLRLQKNGYWGWGKYTGQYRQNGSQVEFTSGNGGPITWGPADIMVPDQLGFDNGGQRVIYQKMALRATAGAAMPAAGSYRCATAPGGCQTNRPITIDGQGSWRWGAQGGSYALQGGKLKFNGLTSGPAGWGPAQFNGGALIFGSGSEASEWRRGE